MCIYLRTHVLDFGVPPFHRAKDARWASLNPEDGFEDDGDDLVDFFQKSGSILALAGKLGILDTSVPAEGKY